MFESRTPKEIQRRIFELTLALYRVTDFFPQGEVLRKHLREKANEIFGSVSEYGVSNGSDLEAVAVLAKIEAIKGYFGLARAMRFVKPINITVLEREYDFLADFFGRELERHSEPEKQEVNQQKVEVSQPAPVDAEELSTWQEFAVNPAIDYGAPKSGVPKSGVNKGDVPGLEPISKVLSERQEKILEHLRQAEQAKISDFIPHFAGVSTKTIQRDLQDLVTRNAIKREGEKRWTVYSINGHG